MSVTYGLILLSLLSGAVHTAPDPAEVFIVPNFHPASCGWLTDWSTERNYCANDYLDHLDRVRDDPNYAFALSECNNMIAILNLHPDRAAELKQRIREGRVELVNAFFLEPTINLSGGEALVKMGVEGLRWQQQVFGVRPRFLWAIDVTGVHEQMAQIVSGLGLDAMVYTRDNPTSKTMHWLESPDGSRCLAICPGHYADWRPLFSTPTPLKPSAITKLLQDARAKAARTPDGAPVLVLGGNGDYSLAPKCKQYPSAFLKQWKQIAPKTKMHFSGPGAYVDAVLPGIKSGRIKLPVSRSGARMSWTSFWIQCPKVKGWYRRAENELQTAEMLATVASLKTDFSYPAESLYHAWLEMLLNMDRNTLWGAAGGMVFEDKKSWDVRDRFESVEAISTDTANKALRQTAGSGPCVGLFNPLNWRRTDPVFVDMPTRANLKGVTCQAEASGRLLCQPRMPSTGVLTLETSSEAAPTLKPMDLPASIETAYYQAKVDPQTGALCSLRLKPSGREVLGGPVLLVAERAGDFHNTPRRDQRKRLADSAQFKPRITVTDGPLATVVRVESTFYGGGASLQTLHFYKDYPRIDFDTVLNDIPDKTVVVAEFPLAQPILETRRGIPYGFSEGAWAKKNPSLAGFADGIVPAIRWSHYQSEHSGVAILDRGLPGRELTGQTPVLFLLNAQEIYMGYPCPWLSGRGRHRFSYALVAHDGDWKDARIPQMAWEFNCPPVVTAGVAGAEPRSFLQTSDNVIVHALRREKNEIELRLAECLGLAGTAEVTLNLPHRGADLTDLIGGRRKPLRGGPTYRFPVRPQQIVTMRFRTDSAVADITPLTDWGPLVPPAKRAALNTKLDKKGHPPAGGQASRNSLKLSTMAQQSVAQSKSAATSNTDGVDAYNVVWDSPSIDCHGSMPLGNGDIGINAWVTSAGDVKFFISKTDAWDDYARLVKVGAVRVHLEPNPFAHNPPFRQTLSLHDATLKIEAGNGPRQVGVKVWVDADLPVIHVTTESASPVEATAAIELWRTKPYEETELQTSDVLLNRSLPNKREAPMIIEPDTILTGQHDRIGWYHHNVKSVGPQLLAKIQGLTGFHQADPLLNRTFGAVVTAVNGRRLDDLHLRCSPGTSHRFNVFVLTEQPAKPQQWLAEMDKTIGRVESQDFTARRRAHERWWSQFWNRSWIRASTSAEGNAASVNSIVPSNRHLVKIGADQHDGNRFVGDLGRVSIFAKPLADARIRKLAKLDRKSVVRRSKGLLWSGNAIGPIANSESWDFTSGFTIEAWLKPRELPSGGARIVDKITPRSDDGFLFDTYPGNSLRLICGHSQLNVKNAVPADRWTHVAAVADSAGGGCRLYINGKLVADNTGAAVHDKAAYISQMYHLQRFIAACAGRGAYPIKFNGSLFTVRGGKRNDPDYRRWGPGYWWQNTRLPYYSMCASGDFDLMQPLWRMYAGDILQLSKYRTKLYCGHDGAFLPECIYFWGPIFSETYGWTPFERRTDKLQDSRYHKWDWVGGLELCWMMLDYYDYTLDERFLQQTVIPFSHEILTFFDQHYRTNKQGKMVMHPAQALETWWDCTNPMPELAGCTAVTQRLLSLPVGRVPAAERRLWRRLRDKLPPLPLRDVGGRKALAPAETFKTKRNVENPELYAVFPFRLIALGRPNLDWGIEALEHRWDRGHRGWRQDDIFMAYLGLTDDARKGLIERAIHHDPRERFPAFWGPNYDWTPDQDHGSVLMKTFQAMLLQTDGRKIFLLPAWPKSWDVDFKLHAPYQTVVEGRYRDGRLQSLKVTPEARRADIVNLSKPSETTSATPLQQP
jgi:alpha-mannosidase